MGARSRHNAKRLTRETWKAQLLALPVLGKFVGDDDA
jgi:hypothetical protein